MGRPSGNKAIKPLWTIHQPASVILNKSKPSKARLTYVKKCQVLRTFQHTVTIDTV